MEIQRLGQAISDYVAQAKHVAEIHYTEQARQTRMAEPAMDRVTQRLADQLDRLDTAMEGLSRVAKTDTPVKELRASLQRVFADAQKDSFAGPMLKEASNLAAALQYERKHGLNEDVNTLLHRMK
jgi:hypothetical protein